MCPVVTLTGTGHRPFQGSLLGALGKDELVDLCGTCLGVGLAEFDQAMYVVRLKEDQAEEVRTVGLPGAESSCQKAEGLRQVGLELVRQAPEVHRGTQDQELDRP